MYLPSEGRPLYGLIRGVVKDADDEYSGSESSESYLDSDGYPWLFLSRRSASRSGNRAVPVDMGVMVSKAADSSL